MPISSSPPVSSGAAGSPLGHFYAYWCSRKNEGALPGRQHIDPTDIPALLPDIMILDYVEGLYRCRLAGTRVVEHFGQEVTGRILDRPLLGRYFEPWMMRLEQVRRSGSPLEGGSDLNWEGREHHQFRWVCVPLASDGTHVDKLMFCLDWNGA